LQEQNYFRDIATINIKIIKVVELLSPILQKISALLLEKVSAVLGNLAQGIGIFSTPI
jgi:hypothetical protein